MPLQKRRVWGGGAPPPSQKTNSCIHFMKNKTYQVNSEHILIALGILFKIEFGFSLSCAWTAYDSSLLDYNVFLFDDTLFKIGLL